MPNDEGQATIDPPAALLLGGGVLALGWLLLQRRPIPTAPPPPPVPPEPPPPPDGVPPTPEPTPEPEPEPIERTAIPNGTLVTHAGSGGRVWVISRGRRREIVTLRTPGDVFAACGYDLHQIQTFPEQAVLAMPAGPDVTGPPDCPFGRRVLPPRPPPPDRNGTELPPTEAGPCPPLGDVNGDGVVDSRDALLIQQVEAGLLRLTPAQRRRADVNGDGRVDSRDALLIQQYAAFGSTAGFRCERFL